MSSGSHKDVPDLVEDRLQLTTGKEWKLAEDNQLLKKELMERTQDNSQLLTEREELRRELRKAEGMIQRLKEALRKEMYMRTVQAQVARILWEDEDEHVDPALRRPRPDTPPLLGPTYATAPTESGSHHSGWTPDPGWVPYASSSSRWRARGGSPEVNTSPRYSGSREAGTS